MSKIIIGIHGLKNKPPRELLTAWWKKSISEGLRLIGRSRFFFRFDLAYWSRFLYPAPLDSAEKDASSPFYLDNPYQPAHNQEIRHQGKLKKFFINKALQVFEDIAFNNSRYFNLDRLGHYVIRKRFKDLYYYYYETVTDKNKLERPLKEIVRNELARLLIKHRKKEIFLIAHSMGAIIAYDVLTCVVPDIPIHTFVTVGSPLGMPLIKKEITEDQQEVFNIAPQLKTPENITHNWYDFADQNDNITMNHDLQNDYQENSRQVRVINKMIENDYMYNEVRNPHKVFGYLRTPELAHIIDDFLNEGRSKLWRSISSKVMKVIGRED